MAKKPIPLPLPIEEKKCEECKKCPPVGAPAWMATFADMATLLMAFFVLILSFAEFNSPKFKMISGSLKNAFGVQREIPIVEQPRGTTVLELKFSPNPQQSISENNKEKTTQVEQKNVQSNESQEGEKDKSTGDEDLKSQAQQQAEALAEALAEQMTDALQQALASGQVSVETQDGKTVMKFSDTATEDQKQALADQLQEAAAAVDQAQKKTGQDGDNVMMQGLADDLQDLADMAQAAASGQAGETGNATGTGSQGDENTGTSGSGKSAQQRKAELNEAELRVALRQEIAQGLVNVETREDKVFITVGSGGSFVSGSADMTEQARDIMNRIAFSSMTDSGKITVTGHTDDVPVRQGSEFRDNWGLAAARSASVVREMLGTGLIDPKQVSAVSMGESNPVADNTTAEGREKNRRIEIEITY